MTSAGVRPHHWPSGGSMPKVSNARAIQASPGGRRVTYSQREKPPIISNILDATPNILEP
eukprot:CAMPEP_0205926762 /NCGR_PEP_ID=MMETSP1325-20131115/21173_1 /ASSEMBLY_ACC=CAM_ASM_000708 /TAXON_ID=236786 /ORGANISM="Florenciella sp., Strain RCC1007" /LENGTH=59 /DNA_ID=CAMNT_0053295529 /DNA_START=318 /DNA_END=494 /DNA_ORIENTATION=-